MITVAVLLLLAAFITCIASFAGKCPLEVSVLCVILIIALQYLPKG